MAEKDLFRERPPAEQHAMAKKSAFYTVMRHDGPVTVNDVIQEQGLCEIRAKKALEDLVTEGKVFKVEGLYYAKRPVPRPTKW